ncbi:flagellar biosynthesis protein FlhF [Alkalihalobacillus sp. BA299]|uniref:flagellar biosynthesis protein FlhF n=1 Tax=Alkalihalobacillus sp. BA299 TaxID=2815938 RepID=UPI001ADA3CFE|nr:flagellar biosynthesis protein FlhF [Alkalihalobacillus sp. BA299]
MKIKKFIAPSMPEAMKKIREELGHDAVILNSREIVSGGFLGFFTKKNIEVIAAIDRTPTIKRPTPKKQQMNEGRMELPGVLQQKKQMVTQEHSQEKLIKEIEHLKTLVTSIATNEVNPEREYPEPFQTINNLLEDQEVAKQLRLQTMKHLLRKWYEKDQVETKKEEVIEWLKAYLLDSIRDIPMGGITFTKRFVNIVGPTGVGKTTTIAKLAAHSVLKKHKKVALITTDTYRIAAVEQLKTYAKILNIPLEVAYSIEDFKKAKDQFSKYDLVLVDSAGRNFRNPLYVEELQNVIDFTDEVETYLVLALTSKYRDMEAIYEKFSLIHIDKVIFTKKDETSYYGSMLTFVQKNKVGIAYITDGQNVPDDITEGSGQAIVNSIVEVKNDE